MVRDNLMHIPRKSWPTSSGIYPARVLLHVATALCRWLNSLHDHHANCDSFKLGIDQSEKRRIIRYTNTLLSSVNSKLNIGGHCQVSTVQLQRVNASYWPKWDHMTTYQSKDWSGHATTVILHKFNNGQHHTSLWLHVHTTTKVFSMQYVGDCL